jgi:MinD-like ATPase involved in chromosome partitioning or flagellar assembly
MKTEILLTINDSPWELALGRTIAESATLKIGRRCVDITEVLTMLEVNEYKICVISSDVQHLDNEVLAVIQSKDCLAVGVFCDGDLDKANQLAQLGFEKILAFSHNEPDNFINNLLACVSQKFGFSETNTAGTSNTPGLIAVWGTAGSPGRTSIAIDIASTLDMPERPCLLIDGDVQAPAIAASLGIAEEISGISAAIHQAQIGKLNHETLFDCLRRDKNNLAVLTGILNPDRWIEVRINGLTRVLNFSAQYFANQVIDLSASLPDTKDANYREFESNLKFGHTASVLQMAEKVIFVINGNPLGVIRAAEMLQNQNIFSPEKLLIVVNKVNNYSFGKSGTKLIENVLHRFIPANKIWFHPESLDIYAKAWLKGRSGYSLLKDKSGLESIFTNFASRRIDFRIPTGESAVRSVA